MDALSDILQHCDLHSVDTMEAQLTSPEPAHPSSNTSGGATSTSGSPSKSFVTTLNEITSRQKMTPVYQLMSQEGMSHEPTFVYKVYVDGFEAIGKGRKKQEARQIAACNLLKKMSLIKDDSAEEDRSVKNGASFDVDEGEFVGPEVKMEIHTRALGLENGIQLVSPEMLDLSSMPLPDLESGSNISLLPVLESAANPEQVKSNDPDQPEVEEKPSAIVYPVPNCREENPVGSLQELTLSIKWPPPRFELVEKYGVAHDAIFTISCYVWCYKSLGRGKSKKSAKREAAANMYEMLRNSPEVKELWQKRSESYAAKSGHRKTAHKQATPKRAPPLQNVHKDLMTRNAESLNLLISYSPEELVMLKDPLGFLQDLANEVKFDILFEDLFDMSQPANSQSRAIPTDKVPSPSLPVSETMSENAAGALIILSLPREVVCFGLGSSKKVARTRAVINALEYLRIASLRSHDGPPPIDTDIPLETES